MSVRHTCKVGGVFGGLGGRASNPETLAHTTSERRIMNGHTCCYCCTCLLLPTDHHLLLLLLLHAATD